MKEGKLGKDKDIFLTDSLDTWENEVRGSSARVFLGTYRHSNGFKRRGAFKFMRPPSTENFDIIEYAKPMFFEEAPILYQLRDVPGVMGMVELGFLKLKNAVEIPPDKESGNGRHLEGKLIRLTPAETNIYLEQLDAKLAEDWVPYLLLERFYPVDNLLLLCDKHRNRGKYFPLRKGLICGIQACEILQTAHEHNIVYRDHKIVHYYWDDDRERLAMIDWNVAKQYPKGISEHDIKQDLALFASRALHYMLAGRPAPGALSTTSRTEEVEEAEDSYQANFSYEDRKHMNKNERNVLIQALKGEYESAKSLGDALRTLLESFEAKK